MDKAAIPFGAQAIQVELQLHLNQVFFMPEGLNGSMAFEYREKTDLTLSLSFPYICSDLKASNLDVSG